MARITFYKNSFLASFVSLAGYGTMAVGIITAIEGEVLGGLLAAAAGFGLSLLAAWISEHKKFKTWIKQLEKKGIPEQVRNSTQRAVEVYNAYPHQQTLEYIRKLNPAAAQYISQNLMVSKK